MKYNSEFKPVNLPAQVAQVIEERILDGELPMGKQLVEMALSETFNTSRSTIRDALKILENKGLVTFTPWKGTFVKEITAQDFENHFPVRAALHGLSAKLAYSKITEEQIEVMTKSLEQMKETPPNKDFRSFMNYHANFHGVIDQASGNETLLRFLTILRTQNLWFHLSLRGYFEENYEETIKKHEVILSTFKKKSNSGEEVEMIIKNHVLSNLEYYRKIWPE